MSDLSPREQLACALEAATESECRKLARIAKLAGVNARIIGNASCARPVATAQFLRICAALNFDPLPEIKHTMILPALFHAGFFAVALILNRRLRKHSLREAAEEIGIGHCTMMRLERGDAASIGVVLRACKYIGQHPFAYTLNYEQENVSRETSGAKAA